MAFLSLSDPGLAIAQEGSFHYQTLFKAALPNQTTAGYFTDASMSAGTPKYNAYAGSALTATQMVGAGNTGIFCGAHESGKTKRLVRWNAYFGQVPAAANLLDYLMFYPLVDGDDTDVQVMDNSVSLPRYASGEGVRAMLVSFAPMTAAAVVTVSYTNSDGVSGRTSSGAVVPAALGGIVVSAAVPANGVPVATSNVCTPFLPLASGDKGMRSIESIQLSSAAGGFMTLVLVKPLARLTVLETGVMAEKMFGVDTTVFPEILSGAYLNIVAQINTTAAAYVLSEFLFANI